MKKLPEVSFKGEERDLAGAPLEKANLGFAPLSKADLAGATPSQARGR